jgi:hypothetical protein
MSLIDTRREQIFPVLDANQIETAKRFASAPPQTFGQGATIFNVGDRHASAWLVLRARSSSPAATASMPRLRLPVSVSGSSPGR